MQKLHLLPIKFITQMTPTDWCIKVQDFVDDTETKSLYSDRNIELTAFYTEVRKRLVGYRLIVNVYEDTGDLYLPRTLYYGTTLFLNYSKGNNRALNVVYQDEHLRLLAFGNKPLKDYFLALHLPKKRKKDYE